MGESEPSNAAASGKGKDMAGSVDLSVVILTNNEAKMIRRCIESVSFASEIVVIDSGSTDDTCAIAEKCGARVAYEPWPGSFAEQRNRGDFHARHQWVLQVDADEVVSNEMAGEIYSFLSSPAAADVVAGKFPRKELIFGKWIEAGGWYPQYKRRLYRHGAGKWVGTVHEDYVGFNGQERTFAGDILHDSYRDIETFIKKFNRYSSIDAEEAYRNGTPFSMAKLVFQPLERFFGRFVIHKGYRDGMHGFVIASLIGLNYFLRYVKLWELYYKNRQQ